MTHQDFPLTPDLSEFAAGLARLLLSRPTPMDVRAGVALQDLIDLAYDNIALRIELGLRETKTGACPQDPSVAESDPLCRKGVAD